MAEPRKPRVIKTRTGATPPPGNTPEPTGNTSAGKAPASSGKPAASGVPGEGSAVRSTSSKVSVQPLTPADDAGVPAAGKAPAGGSSGGKPGGIFGRAWGKAVGAAAPKDASNAAPEASPAAGGKMSGAAGGKVAPKRPGTTSGAAGSHASDSTTKSGGAAGAQVLAFPLPPHKRRRRNVIYGVAGVVVVMVLVMAVAIFSPALAVKTVVFEGRKLVSEQTLQTALAPVIGTPLPQVTEGEVQDLLKPVIQVKSAIISAQPPSTLVVRLVERVPVALLKNNDDYLLVDQDGVELGATTDPTSVALPLIDGGKAVIGQATFNAMTAVLANLPQNILGQLANASAASPDAVELKLTDGRSVIWGDASDMELKAQVLEALLNAPAPTAAPGKPEPAPVQVFDVSAPRHPVTR